MRKGEGKWRERGSFQGILYLNTLKDFSKLGKGEVRDDTPNLLNLYLECILLNRRLKGEGGRKGEIERRGKKERPKRDMEDYLGIIVIFGLDGHIGKERFCAPQGQARIIATHLINKCIIKKGTWMESRILHSLRFLMVNNKTPYS